MEMLVTTFSCQLSLCLTFASAIPISERYVGALMLRQQIFYEV